MLNVLAIITLFISCETPAGHSGISNNIQESKRRGVFISEYTIQLNPYKINDSLDITIEEAWLEKQWAYGKHEDETKLYPTEEYQLCINSTEKDVKKYLYLDFTIGVESDKYMRSSSKESLVGDFKNLPGDTIKYEVQRGNDLREGSKKNVIGNLILVKNG